jgi:hypothetical protein
MATSRDLERFDQKWTPAPNGCWIWIGGNVRGYGMFKLEGKSRRAARVAYEWFVGPIPDGLEIDHTCRNPPCVNPKHLEPVTQYENSIMRGVTNSASINARKTHCSRGHHFDQANTYIHPDGSRHCRQCQKIYNRNYRESH